ncbi:MAG: hypothetical protein ACR2HD_04400 [Solirubrobacteraceae bacterium]|nr:MAG: hypothetical protein DLM63_07375 [Solirubrobacterales bacterium]
MPRLVPLGLALLLGLSSASFVACGANRSTLLSAHKAGVMQTDLDALASAVAQHDCAAATVDLAHARAVLHSARNISATLAARLSAAFDELEGFAQSECRTTTSTTSSSTSTTSTPSTTSTASTTPTATTATSTSTETTSQTSTTPTTQSTDTNGGASPGNPGNGGG